MELEELKSQWNQLNEHLQKNEQLNLQLLKKVTSQRVLSLWNRFIYIAIVGAVVVGSSLIAIILNHHTIASRLEGTPGLIVIYSLLTLVFLYEIFLTFFLIQHNPIEKTLTKGYRFVLSYQKQIKIETISTIITLLILIPLMAYWRHIHTSWFYLHTAFLTLFTLGIIMGGYWYYMKNFREIKKNLQELEEFEK